MEIVSDISIGEETLTDINLQDLQIKHPFEIITEKFNRRIEAKNGADWEWWFTDGIAFSGFRVQAKKLNLNTGIYPDVYKSNKYGRQIDNLIESAHKNRMIPIYVFYTYFDNKKNYRSLKSGSEWLSSFGCSILPAIAVKNNFQNDFLSLDDICPFIEPWENLVCSKSEKLTLPSRTERFINKFLSEFETQNSNREERYYNLDKKPPDYVFKMIEKQELNIEDWDMIGADRISIIKET